MNYKGFTIEINKDGKRGLDYLFYSDELCLSGYARSVANAKNQIDILLLK